MIDPTQPDGRTPIHPARAVVTGAIRWTDGAAIKQLLDLSWRPAQAAGGSFRVLTGMASGADAYARAWTQEPPQLGRVHLFAEALPHGEAPESVHGYNRALLALQPDLILAFKEPLDKDWRSPTCAAGTEHMCRIADAAGVPILLNGKRWIHRVLPPRSAPTTSAIEVSCEQATLRAYRGDITESMADVIVNAANSSLLGGGGVDGAIHRAAGPALLAACRKVVARQGGCKTGEAVITGAGDLKARFVVHTVGPVWTGDESASIQDALLARCYSESLGLAAEAGATSIAFPGISTGVYRFPKGRAAELAVQTVRAAIREGSPLIGVDFVCFADEDLHLYHAALQRLAE